MVAAFGIEQLHATSVTVFSDIGASLEDGSSFILRFGVLQLDSFFFFASRAKVAHVLALGKCDLCSDAAVRHCHRSWPKLSSVEGHAPQYRGGGNFDTVQKLFGLY